MEHSLGKKWLIVIAIVIVPILLVWGYLGMTKQTHLIQDNWKLTKALITLSRRPSNISATILAGEGYYGLKQYQRAAEYYLTATRLNSDADFVWNALGNTYRELSLYNDAERSYNQAIAINSDVPTYYLNLADLYKRLPALQGSRDKQIVATLTAGLKATDNDPDLLRAIVDYYQQAGDPKQADKYQKLLDAQAQ